MVAGFDAAEVGERFDYSYGAMEATVEIGDIVEENDTSDTGGVGGLAKKSAHHGIEATGFVDEGGPNPVGFGGEKVSRGGGSDGSGEAGDDGAGGFAAGVGVDDTNGNRIRHGILFAVPIGPPVTEELLLGMEELALAELIVLVDLVFISGVAFEN